KPGRHAWKRKSARRTHRGNRFLYDWRQHVKLGESRAFLLLMYSHCHAPRRGSAVTFLPRLGSALTALPFFMSRLSKLALIIGRLPQRIDYAQRLTPDQARDQAQPWRAWYKTKRWQRLRWHVLVRDGFTCQGCGELKGKSAAMVADHIKPHRGNAELFWNA